MRLQRVLLADDHRLLVEAFRVLLEPHYEVVGAVFDGHALLEAVLRLHPDVVVLDIAMPLLNGLDAGRQLKQKMPEVKLVILTMNQDPDLATKAMEAGASAYLLKSSAGSELFHAIAEALKGRSYVTKQIARGMQESFMRDPRPRERAKVLSSRQREVIQLLAEGKSMKEAGDVLSLKPRTVAFHKYRVMEEMGFKSTAELVQFAVKNNMVAMA
jgi:DNA-binding NarL/FixJ family response regulator